MTGRIGIHLLLAVVLIACAAPVTAAETKCTVTVPGVRLRKGPGFDAKVMSILKQGTVVSTDGACGNGWVKAVSGDGGVSGYVAGWFLTEMAPQSAGAPVVTPADSKLKAAGVMEESPSNEQLAIEITNLRLDVLWLNRQIDEVRNEVRKMKVNVAHNSRGRHVAANAVKGNKQKAKKLVSLMYSSKGD